MTAFSPTTHDHNPPSSLNPPPSNNPFPWSDELQRTNSLFFPLDKIQRFGLTDHDDRAALALVPHPIALLRHQQHLGTEGGADELTATASPFSVAVPALSPRDGLEHVGDGGAVLGVEVGVDLVKEVERRRVTLLNGENESKGAEA